MANEITRSTTSSDQEKYLAAKLLQRSYLKLVAASVCDKLNQPKGTGIQANFVRYKRMNVPLTTLTEGTTPSNSTFTLETVTVSLDQWGDVITITDVAELTTKHPLMQEAEKLLMDNAQRVIDREVQIVMVAGTNVQYGDGSVTSRASVTASMKVDDTTIHKARITMVNNGAPPRDGPAQAMENAKGMSATGNFTGGNSYVAICGAEVISDIMKMASSSGLWAQVAQYQNAKAIYNGEVGTYLNMRWVETNFIPRFKLLGNTTAAVVSTNAFGTDTPVVTAVDGGGSLTSSTTYYFKVTRKDKTRGFEEDISIEHSMASTATGNNESFTFNFSSLTAGYVYNLYFGSSTGDANLKLHTENIEVGTTVTVTAVPSSTTTPPANNKTDGTVSKVYPIFILGADAISWVGLQDLKAYITGAGADKSDPIDQRRTLGYKFMAKSVIKDQNRLLRLEVASAF